MTGADDAFLSCSIAAFVDRYRPRFYSWLSTGRPNTGCVLGG
jgi:hypothetical protein